MEFSYQVDQTTDVAIGTEIAPDVIDTELDDFDYSDCDPIIPTEAKPGSEDKVKMLAARYAAGVPLWHDEDCYDHGPSGAAGLMEADDYDSDFDLDD